MLSSKVQTWKKARTRGHCPRKYLRIAEILWLWRVIKSDVQGSSEALKMAINKIEHNEVKANIILSDIGMINETDVYHSNI